MSSVLVALESHFGLWQENAYNFNMTRKFWQRYRNVFDEVIILARAKTLDEAPDEMKVATGDGVRIHPLPDYYGPIAFLKKRAIIREEIAKALPQADSVILRIPGTISNEVYRQCRTKSRPYAVEVMGDPWESLKGHVPWPIDWMIRVDGYRKTRNICKNAAAAAYVTRDHLSRRYPANNASLTTNYSSIELPDDACLSTEQLAPRHQRLDEAFSGRRKWRIGFIGTFSTMYKAPEIHLAAIRQCHDAGIDVEFHLVGDGKFRHAMEKRAEELKITDATTFRGLLPAGDAIFEFLDSIDLFLIASRTEGLPRALIEAMARGCPAIGSNVGGIPELLELDSMVNAGNANELAAKIREFLSDRNRMLQQSNRNCQVARDYRQSVLCERRTRVYEFMKSLAHPDRAETPSGVGR